MRSSTMPGLPTHLVQELNVGTVVAVMMFLIPYFTNLILVLLSLKLEMILNLLFDQSINSDRLIRNMNIPIQNSMTRMSKKWRHWGRPF